MAQKGQKGGPKPVILDPFLTPFGHMAKRAKRGDYRAKYRGYWDTFWPLGPKGPKQPKGPKRGQKGVKMTQKQLFLTMFWDPFLTPFSHMAKRAKRGDYGAISSWYWDTFWPLWPKGPKQPKGPKRGQKPVKMTQKQVFLTMFWDPFLTPFATWAKWAKRGDYGSKYRGYWDTLWPLLAHMAKTAKWPKKGQKGSFWVVSKGLRWQTAKTGQNGHFGQKGPKWPKQPYTPYLTYRSAYNPRPL